MDLRRSAGFVAMLAAPVLLVAGPVSAVLSASAGMAPDQRPDRLVAPFIHADAVPAGLSLHSPTTSALLRAAGVRTTPHVPRASIPHPSGPVPPGTPTMVGLSAHVSPSCVGTGSDGNRVQVAYVTEVGRTDRYASVLPALRSYVADVDDVMAESSAETGGGRRVRWVTSANCVPTVLHVVLPAGSLADFGNTIAVMESLGYTAANRKYLMFAEDVSGSYCGIAQVYGDSSKSVANFNNGQAPMFEAVESPCWTLGSGQHSVAAHELMHSLGSVMDDSPNSSTYGHCTDDYDVMCYIDGPGVMVRTVCAPAHEQLYDCNHDDYFSTNPGPSNYLATHWNAADSAFLDVVPVLGAPAPPAYPVTPHRPR